MDPPKTHDWAKDESPTRLHHEVAPRPSEQNDLSTIATQSSTASRNNSLGTEKMSSSLRRTRSHLGLHPDAPIDEDHDLRERQKLLWSRIRIVLREPFAEFWGTVIMVM